MEVCRSEQNGVRQNSLPVEVVEGGMGRKTSEQEKRCETKRPPSCSGLATGGTPGMRKKYWC